MFPVNSTINPTIDGSNGAPFSAEVWVRANTQPVGFETPLDDSSDFGQPPPFNNSAGWNFYQTPWPGKHLVLQLKTQSGLCRERTCLGGNRGVGSSRSYLQRHERRFLCQWFPY